MNTFRFFILLTALCANLAANAAATSAAMLTALHGQLENQGKSVALFDEFPPDTTLLLREQAQASLVLFSSGQEFVLKGPIVITIKTHSIEAAGKPLAGKTLLAEAQQIKLAAQDFDQAAIMMRGNFDPLLLSYPTQTQVLERHPDFSWQAPGEGYLYHLEIFNAGGDSIYSGQTKQTHLQLPDTIQLPEAQTLIWELEATKGGEALSNQAQFRLVPQTIATQLNQAKPSPQASASEIALYQHLLANLGLTAEANKYRARLHP